MRCRSRSFTAAYSSSTRQSCEFSHRSHFSTCPSENSAREQGGSRESAVSKFVATRRAFLCWATRMACICIWTDGAFFEWSFATDFQSPNGHSNNRFLLLHGRHRKQYVALQNKKRVQLVGLQKMEEKSISSDGHVTSLFVFFSSPAYP